MSEVVAQQTEKPIPEKPGEYKVLKNDAGEYIQIVFGCPCGCGCTLGASLKPAVPNGWDWNGSIEKPTCSPSIRHLDGCGWHGFLTDGVFRDA